MDAFIRRFASSVPSLKGLAAAVISPHGTDHRAVSDHRAVRAVSGDENSAVEGNVQTSGESGLMSIEHDSASYAYDDMNFDFVFTEAMKVGLTEI